ncbi:hypothetical protein NDI76_12550 [Halogeometricum sp. S1BR25-6]|uniref:Uncharacterized protein n=1 Tax=Halogeometricum salsisoli TaxID=2950536 RepID=A0ABU2GFJ1_9EURY|nr:hypothetical protein [Halogeometricum sp. S1BR25-6]MDS0299572.1 hypothetical protein [Halogeometricum sp. S1BR25-6]
MNLETRIRELHRDGDDGAVKQLIRAAISCGNGAEYRVANDRVHVSHSAYTGSHDIVRGPGSFGQVRVVARGTYRFTGGDESLDVELDAVNSKAVQFGRAHIDGTNAGGDVREAGREDRPATAP